MANIKQNKVITKSLAKTIKTQCIHISAAIVSYTKFERYKFSAKLNHFALKAKLFIQATKTTYRIELVKLQQVA